MVELSELGSINSLGFKQPFITKDLQLASLVQDVEEHEFAASQPCRLDSAYTVEQVEFTN